MKRALLCLGLAALAPASAEAKLLRRTADAPDAAAAAPAAHGLVAAEASRAKASAAAAQQALEAQAIRDLNAAYGQRADSEEYSGYDVDDDERAAKEMVKKTGSDEAGTYGEVQPEGVALMLRAVQAKPGMKYYDLGSGTGKTVALAWLLGLDATGVELSEVRYRASCGALGQLPAKPPVAAPEGKPQGLRFRLENIENTDFSDADIVFANSVLLTNHTLDILADRARTMKVGARLVTYRGLPGPGFRMEGKFHVPCSWFPDVPYVVQTVVQPMQAQKAPALVQLKEARLHEQRDDDEDEDDTGDVEEDAAEDQDAEATEDAAEGEEGAADSDEQEESVEASTPEEEETDGAEAFSSEATEATMLCQK